LSLLAHTVALAGFFLPGALPVTLKEKAFSIVTEDRFATSYPQKRLNLDGLMRLAWLITKRAPAKC